MTETESRFFCLEEIARAKSLIDNTVIILPEIRSNYEKNKDTNKREARKNLQDLQMVVKSLLEGFPMLIQQLNELGDTQLKETTLKLQKVLKGYDYIGTVDYTPLCKALKIFADKLPQKENEINTGALAHMANRAKMGYFPTDSDHVNAIRNAMVFPDEKVSIIDPCCGEGLALEHFAKDTLSDTYGTEIDTVRAEEAQGRLTKVGFGSFFYSNISINAFQCVFLNPPYLSAPSENGMRRLEKSFLAESIRLLQYDGILIYIIPYYRAEKDVCRMLCENFTNLSVFRFIGKEFERFHQVVFIGKRIKRRDAYEQTEKLFEFMLEQNNIPEITALRSGIYEIPKQTREVGVFRGAKFNVTELAEQLRKSDSINRLFSEKALDDRERRPLLPLNLSQIGLVGASGMMNGLIEGDTPHIIKGRVIKEKKSNIMGENQKGNTEIREVVSNKLIFNILTPNGFKSLG